MGGRIARMISPRDVPVANGRPSEANPGYNTPQNFLL
jgi:hypothetical protein